MTHPAMGTIYSLYVYAHSLAKADADAELVFEEIDRVEALLSNYKESSELSRINREASTSAVTTDPETFRFLQTSLAWSARSDGAFDITVGQLMKAWGFFRANGAIPTKADLAHVRSEVGWQRVQLNSEHRTVRFLSPGIELDPGGIGKGYAVDRAVAIMRREHVPAALLSAGSSTIYALGAPPGQQGWKIRVPALGHAENILSTTILRDTSLSTANCSEKHFISDGHLYCSIMDPRTLLPVEGMLQATVVAPSATDSDALSNVLFVLGAKGGAEVLRDRPQDSALILSGRMPAAQCEAIRWHASITPGYCTNSDTRKED
ncbi:MAG: FAD:protein FMN transferase [Acidobacteriaceae bacterium]